VPPVATDGADGDELRLFVLNDFLDVRVALKNSENVIVLEEFANFRFASIAVANGS
jgi:hypothetical protein